MTFAGLFTFAGVCFSTRGRLPAFAVLLDAIGVWRSKATLLEDAVSVKSQGVWRVEAFLHLSGTQNLRASNNMIAMSAGGMISLDPEATNAVTFLQFVRTVLLSKPWRRKSHQLERSERLLELSFALGVAILCAVFKASLVDDLSGC